MIGEITPLARPIAAIVPQCDLARSVRWSMAMSPLARLTSLSSLALALAACSSPTEDGDPASGGGGAMVVGEAGSGGGSGASAKAGAPAAGGTAGTAGASGKNAAGAGGAGVSGSSGGGGKGTAGAGTAGGAGKGAGGSAGATSSAGGAAGKSSGAGGGTAGGSSTGGSGTGGSGTAGTGTGGGAGSSSTGGGATEYAPYFYTWGWGAGQYQFPDLATLRKKTQISGVTLAFVLSNGGCAPTDDVQQHKGDVDAFRNAGGKLKASFGGADGTYLENACGDAGSLAAAIESFITATGITDLDFDVEQAGAMNDTVNTRRAKALKQVQTKTGAKIAFTLAANPADKWGTPGGVTAASLDVLKAVVAEGVTISHVNLMVMDYGGYYSDGKKMGDLAVSALQGANAQLVSIVPGLTETAAWPMLGATPMIGVNDVSTEVFGLADAQILADFAKTKKVGLLAFWAIQRDQAGKGDLGLYSGVNTSAFQFNAIFQAVAQ
jgi:hypothetical protein